MRSVRKMVLLLGAAFAGAPAHGCDTYAPLDLQDVFYADHVVVGRVMNYRLVSRKELSQQYSKTPPVGSPQELNQDEAVDHPGISHAQFDVIVDKILRGDPIKSFVATWDNSTFVLPPNITGAPQIIAVRKADSSKSSLSERRNNRWSKPHAPNSFAILQSACSDPFMFNPKSFNAIVLQTMILWNPNEYFYIPEFLKSTD